MCRVIGVGGWEQGVQGIGPPLLGLGDNPLTLSDALVKCVAWRFHVECCHCLHLFYTEQYRDLKISGRGRSRPLKLQGTVSYCQK